MTESLVVVGAGGMARCTLDVIDAINLDQSTFGRQRFRVVGVVADPPPEDPGLFEARGVEYLGGIAAFAELPADVGFVVGIGDGQVRRKIAEALVGRPSPVLVHPNAHLGHGVELGAGSVICSHVSIESNATLGAHVHANQNCTIGHDARLADHVTVSPLVAISGNVTAGEAAFFGAGSSVRERITVGAGATVGMGAAVVDDVEPGATVVGVPARVGHSGH